MNAVPSGSGGDGRNRHSFLLPTEFGIQVKYVPWGETDMNRVLSISLKISVDSAIYVPQTFWLYYGIPINGPIIRNELPDKLLLRSAQLLRLLHTENHCVYTRVTFIFPRLDVSA